nr:MAG TPA: hypothetical protein [Caudoviricetes sp.]
MTNLANMNLEINEEVIQTIFKDTLNQAIVSAMGNKEEYMTALVNSALSQKVNEKGKVSNYSYDNKYSFLDIQIKNTIRSAADEAIKEYLNDNKELLKRIVKREMEKEENKSALVNAFVRGAVDTFNYDYNFKATVDVEPADSELY